MSGMDTVYKFDKVPTKKEGIFVMPLERITILSTFVVYVDDPNDTEGTTFVLNKNEIPAFKPDSSSSAQLSLIVVRIVHLEQTSQDVVPTPFQGGWYNA